MTDFKKYPSIKSLRHVLKYCREYHPGLQIIEYRGTVKLHGSNSGFVVTKNGQIKAQSRNNIITPEQDNYGFAQYIEDNSEKIIALADTYYPNQEIRVYGEWCGPGIQKGVGISKLKDKSFFIFRVEVDRKIVDVDNHEYTPETSQAKLFIDSICTSIENCYNILNFKQYVYNLDLSNPDTETLVQLVNEVDSLCPVANALGIDGFGEGIVFESTCFNSSFTFKIKGEKHSDNKNKNGKIVVVDPEVLKTARDFADRSLTEHRMEKGVDFIKETIDPFPTMEQMGPFLKWLNEDIFEEEGDLAQGLDRKLINKIISERARNWFMEKYK